MPDPLRVLMITSEWPAPDKPHEVPFIVRQVKFLREAGIDLTLFPFRGRKKLSNYWRAWREAQKHIRSGRYDLVHAQWGQSGLIALPKQLPLVVTYRGDDLEGIIGKDGRHTMQGKVLSLISRLVARQADQVIVVSEQLARLLPPRPYHVIPSGLDLDLFCPEPQVRAREKLGLALERRYVLFAGSAWNPRKRIDLAKQAVDLLNDRFDIELLTASGVAHDLIPTFMNASDVLLLTSLHEGSPNVVKEALAVNLPVVSTDVGDVSERIADIAGCHVLPDDQPGTIAAVLQDVLTKQQRTDSRTTVMGLDEKIQTRKVIELYEKAVSGYRANR